VPAALLSYRVRGSRLIPRFLEASDIPWLRELLDEYQRFVGKRRRELASRLKEPLAFESPDDKRRLACHVLSRMLRSNAKTPLAPEKTRASLFSTAAKRNAERGRESWRDAVLQEAARALGSNASDLEASIFGDLSDEQFVSPLPAALSPNEVMLRSNLALVQGILQRANAVRIELDGNSRAVLRLAKLRGLICQATVRGAESAMVEISGPLALFRRTLIYGRALGELVPALAWCRRFKIEASCHVGGGAFDLVICSGDPIFPSNEPRRYDSALEERFARDFQRFAPDWHVVREPQPIQIQGAHLFPDFALEHRLNPQRRWLLEIIGFWTPEYLEAKISSLRSAQIKNLIICVDAQRGCGESDFPNATRVIQFRRRIDPAEVMAAIETAI
jgi:uncharacterized protein